MNRPPEAPTRFTIELSLEEVAQLLIEAGYIHYPMEGARLEIEPIQQGQRDPVTKGLRITWARPPRHFT